MFIGSDYHFHFCLLYQWGFILKGQLSPLEKSSFLSKSREVKSTKIISLARWRKRMEAYTYI